MRSWAWILFLFITCLGFEAEAGRRRSGCANCGPRTVWRVQQSPCTSCGQSWSNCQSCRQWGGTRSGGCVGCGQRSGGCVGCGQQGGGGTQGCVGCGQRSGSFPQGCVGCGQSSGVTGAPTSVPQAAQSSHSGTQPIPDPAFASSGRSESTPEPTFTRHQPGQDKVDGIKIPPGVAGHKFLPTGEMHWVDAMGKKVGEVTDPGDDTPDAVEDPNEDPIVTELAKVIHDPKELFSAVQDLYFTKTIEKSEALNKAVQELEEKLRPGAARKGIEKLRDEFLATWRKVIEQLEKRRERTGDRRFAHLAAALKTALDDPKNGAEFYFAKGVLEPMIAKSVFCVPCNMGTTALEQGFKEQDLFPKKDAPAAYNGDFARYNDKAYRFFIHPETGEPSIAEKNKSDARALDPEKDAKLLEAFDEFHAKNPLNDKNSEAERLLIGAYKEWRKDPAKAMAKAKPVEEPTPKAPEQPTIQNARGGTSDLPYQGRYQNNYTEWRQMLDAGRNGSRPLQEVFDYQMQYLGLTGFVTWKGPGQHFIEGNYEYGVTVEWDKIQGLDPNRRRTIIERLRNAATGSLMDYKLERGQGGFCLKCHLTQDSSSSERLWSNVY